MIMFAAKVLVLSEQLEFLESTNCSYYLSLSLSAGLIAQPTAFVVVTIWDGSSVR